MERHKHERKGGQAMQANRKVHQAELGYRGCRVRLIHSGMDVLCYLGKCDRELLVPFQKERPEVHGYARGYRKDLGGVAFASDDDES